MFRWTIHLTIFTPVLDASLGKPARGVPVQLQKHRKISDSTDGEVFAFDPIAHRYVITMSFLPARSPIHRYSVTNEDGRCLDLLTATRASVEHLAVLRPGLYKIVFQTKEYFAASNRECFYPWVEVWQRLKRPDDK